MAWERGAGKGREGAEGVDVDYARERAAEHLTTATTMYRKKECASGWRGPKGN